MDFSRKCFIQIPVKMKTETDFLHLGHMTWQANRNATFQKYQRDESITKETRINRNCMDFLKSNTAMEI